MADQIKHPGTPRVDACIEAVSKRFPSLKSTAYYEDVHQHIAPLARDMEREIADLRAALQAQQGDVSDEAILAELEIVKAAGNLQSLALVTNKAGIAYARAILALAARREG